MVNVKGVEMDSDLFREIMSGFPAGVTVVTAYDAEGHPQGLTVNAFCSVSVSPPLVLVCVDKRSNTLPAIQDSRAFTVNFLSSENQELAMLFASKREDKFVGVPFDRPRSVGGPILREHYMAYVACSTWQEVDAGDHLVFIGRVQDGEVNEERYPLVYGARRFAGWHEVGRIGP
jgi:flavin reductase (DIM6/NTAB) family NADH-FMN oxidoreductase RutF